MILNLMVALLFVLSGPAVAQKNSPSIVEGKVLSESTGQPVTKAHVYILDGEEEALTNNKGEFRIKTWQVFIKYCHIAAGSGQR